MPGALGIVWATVHDSVISMRRKKEMILFFDGIFGLKLDMKIESIQIPLEIQSLIEARDAARATKDFAKSDELRAHIESLGFEVMDTAEGTKVKIK